MHAINNVRICQFFLRGKCQRQNCQFLHSVELIQHINGRKSDVVQRSRSREMRDQGKESVDDTVSSDEEERKEIVRVHE